jgi:REP element-mobilizing transposase RayT
MPSEIPPITFGTFFHIYNRGNNGENIFIQERNYAYFMDLWWKHTSKIFETWAYCCMRNHFHVAGYVKDEKDLTGLPGTTVNRDLRVGKAITPSDSREDLSGLKTPSQYFSNCFNAYSRGVNLAVGRTGALFERPFKRIPIASEAYLMRLIVYIHQNPQKHGFEADFRDWKYSSYHELAASVPTQLQREKVLNLFGSREDFIRMHQEIQPLTDFENYDETKGT